MLTVRDGDIFKSQAQTLVNPVNTAGAMGKGLALEFKRRYPELYQDYVRRCEHHEVEIGRPYVFRVSPERLVVNFPTKRHWRARSKLPDIVAGLEHLAERYEEWGITSLALPALGCGEGKLEWATVEGVLRTHLARLDIPVEVYKPRGAPPLVEAARIQERLPEVALPSEAQLVSPVEATRVTRKKLIEVALPLEAINRESAREKSIRHGHPSTLHLWWARRPLAACRAVLFASIVDDPSSRPDLFPTEEEQEAERRRLFGIIERLVKWENTTNEDVLNEARAEIMKATDGNPPPVLDPFCGGGSIPLEAQRLGLEAHASDLNPVAVLITKALIEIPTKFAGRPPVNPEALAKLGHGATWKGAQGLAGDVRYYGKWMRDHAFERIGHLYPKAKLSDGGVATVIAWIWARTMTCPNPACGMRMPLVQGFWLSRKPSNRAWVDAFVDPDSGQVGFTICGGDGSPSEGTVGRRGARCIACGQSVTLARVREAATAADLGVELMAIVAEGRNRRVFLSPDAAHVGVARSAEATDFPDAALPKQALGFRVQGYGLKTFSELFTERQLVTLTTFSDLVREAHERILGDCAAVGCDPTEAAAYADAVVIYLSLAVSKAADLASAWCHWQPNPQHLKLAPTFIRHALPMSWDFAEGNPFSDSSGNFLRQFELVAEVLERLPSRALPGVVTQLDARVERSHASTVATDPPYYDNIGYADLSDFFYIWLRRSLSFVVPELTSTMLTPKASELVASPGRFPGGQEEANRAFESGLEEVFRSLARTQDKSYPMTLFYAFKQMESQKGETAVASTGWETMLEGLVRSGFSITGTWPMRTERSGRPRDFASNALASSVVLVCRPRRTGAPLTTRRDFVVSLRAELPEALRQLQYGNIAPVDLAQAAIGPGMAIFSRYAKVIEANGERMTVRTALGLINTALDEILAEQEGDFDGDTRFAVSWFEQRGTAEGPYGEADVLARAKNTAVSGLEEAGILVSRAGRVRLLRPDELPERWDPARDRRLTVWEIAQHLIRHLETGGERSAAELLRAVGGLGDVARELAYRLYTICERKGWAQEALGYNALVVAWPEIARLAVEQPNGTAQQRLGV